MITKLGVNIDHIATIRQARKALEPDPVAAAFIAETAGAHGITIHLRSDRRHIQDRDLIMLRETVKTRLNVEMAASEEMISVVRKARPDTVTLVPEKPEELTTEGGLNVIKYYDEIEEENKEKLKEFQEFISYYPINFFYGPMGDDYNYLDFDEGSLYWILFNLRAEDNIKKEKFEEAKDQAKKLLAEF